MKKMIIGVMLGCMLLAGCGSSYSSDSYSGAASTYEAEESYGNTIDDSTSLYEESKSYSEASDTDSSLFGTEYIRNVYLTISSDKISEISTHLSDLSASYNGYMQSSDMGESYGYFTVKIPADEADSFLEEIKESYDITNINDSVSDVTLEYTDIESRLKTKQAALAQYEALMEKAETIEDIIAIQDKMDEITADIESYTAQKNAMDSMTEYTTFDISVSTPTSGFSYTAVDLSYTFMECLGDFLNAWIHLIFIVPTCMLILFIAVKTFFFARKTCTRSTKGSAKGTMQASQDQSDHNP